MSDSIILEFGTSSSGQQLNDYVYLWAKYVYWFNPQKHCIQCLRGHRVPQIKPGMIIPSRIVLDRFTDAPFVYLCGVDMPRGNCGLHVAMKHAPGSVIKTQTLSGASITIHNAHRLAIPELADGWHGYPVSYTRCMNFRFGVTYMGTNPGEYYFNSVKE